MRRLADSYASLIEVETKREEDKYRQELEEWELKKMAAHRKGQPVRVAEAPVPASTCYFFNPYTDHQGEAAGHLADNGRDRRPDGG